MWKLIRYGRAAFGVGFATGLCAWPAPAATSLPFDQLHWNWDPLVLSGLSLSLVLYFVGLGRLGRVARSALFGWARCAAFLAGIAILFVALISPFDALDDELFSAHMLQHLILLLVAPPLLISGRPAIAWLWAFPLNVRKTLGHMWMKTGLHNLLRTLMSPLIVWLLCTAALWFWHLPGPYGWALNSESVHAFEHACFFVTSLMFWTLVLEPFGRRRLSYGGALLFVATYGLQNGLLGALLTFAGRPLYGAYLQTTAVWGLTPLEDQQLSGLIMWIPASFVHLAALAFLFVAWMRAAERNSSIAVKAGARSVFRNAYLSCLLFALLLGWITGCANTGLANRQRERGSRCDLNENVRLDFFRG